MRRRVDKGIAGAAVVLFFAAVRPTQIPSMWITVLLALALYEGMLFGIKAARRQARRERRRHYITVSRIDMQRVADQVFNPIREVS